MDASPFVQRFNPKPKLPSTAPSAKALPTLPTALTTTDAGKRYNPFLSAMNTESSEFKDVYGVNKPLAKPMFLGYKDDKALYGGARLFILY